MFFMYTTSSECNSQLLWHIIFLNNIIPWASHDNCMSWTWYLANDMQFFLLVPLLVQFYYKRRTAFYIVMLCLLALSIVI